MRHTLGSLISLFYPTSPIFYILLRPVKKNSRPCSTGRLVRTNCRLSSGSPVNCCFNTDVKILDDYSNPEYGFVRKGKEIALIGDGLMFGIMAEAADILTGRGVDVTLINPRNLSTLDTVALDSLKEFKTVVTAKDGIIDGGYGQKVASYLGADPVKVINLGLPKEFLNRYNYSELQKQCHLTPELIAQTVLGSLE